MCICDCRDGGSVARRGHPDSRDGPHAHLPVPLNRRTSGPWSQRRLRHGKLNTSEFAKLWKLKLIFFTHFFLLLLLTMMMVFFFLSSSSFSSSSFSCCCCCCCCCCCFYLYHEWLFFLLMLPITITGHYDVVSGRPDNRCGVGRDGSSYSNISLRYADCRR